jgi:hypothetical protein
MLLKNEENTPKDTVKKQEDIFPRRVRSRKNRIARL